MSVPCFFSPVAWGKYFSKEKKGKKRKYLFQAAGVKSKGEERFTVRQGRAGAKKRNGLAF